MQLFMKKTRNLDGNGLDTLRSLQNSIDMLDSQERAFRREQRDNHSLVDDLNNDEESFLLRNQRILAATEPLLDSPKQARNGPFGFIGKCARRMSFDRRRRSSASRKPSSPAILPIMSPSNVPNIHPYIEPLVFARAGTCSIPHPDKFEKGGEDANIVCIGPDGSTLTAVLDGVGGWAAVGVDSGKYSRALAERIGIEFDAWHDRQAQMKARQIPPRRKFMVENQKPLLCILERAFDYVEDLGIQGTCTACLSLVLPNGKLHVLNLGDSGLRVVRDNRVVFATVEQQLGFNYPRQIGTNSTDIPADGDYAILDVIAGDSIISGSDGVWDNLWEHEYLPLLGVGRQYEYSAGLERTSRRIAEAAYRRGMDPYYLSPFASNGMQAGIPNCLGGKLDDTTVVVQRVWDNLTIASA